MNGKAIRARVCQEAWGAFLSQLCAPRSSRQATEHSPGPSLSAPTAPWRVAAPCPKDSNEAKEKEAEAAAKPKSKAMPKDRPESARVPWPALDTQKDQGECIQFQGRRGRAEAFLPLVLSYLTAIASGSGCSGFGAGAQALRMRACARRRAPDFQELQSKARTWAGARAACF